MKLVEKQWYFIIGLAISAIIVSMSLFTVDQRVHAVVFQFGEAVRTIDKPGLKFKVPFIQTVEYFDKRVLTIDAEAKELTASDGKRIIIDAFAKYKIVDPVTFYKTVNNTYGVEIRLNRILESSMRKVIGRMKLMDLLSSKRSDIMHEINEIVQNESKHLGIDLIDVRILRADLPKENSMSVYKRMQTEREKEAKQIRAEGEEGAARITSKADRESKIILAEAYKKSEILRGEGDEVASSIYNKAYAQDREFYQFYRSLNSYEKALNDGKTSFILSPDSEFLKYLKVH